MAHEGQAASYYEEGQERYQQYQAPTGPPPPQAGYQQYEQPQYQQQPPQQQQQQYGQTDNYESKYSQPPPSYGENFNAPQDNKQDFAQTFVVQKPKYNDLWAGILLILVFCGFVAVSGLSIYRYSKYKGFSGEIYNNTNSFSLNGNTVILFIFVILVALVFSWAYFFAARRFTKLFVWITGIANCALAIGTAVYYLYKHYWGTGIVFAIFAIFSVICFISWIPRIPFAVLMLQTSMDVSRKVGHVFIVSLIGGLIGAGFSAWFSITLVAIYVAYEPGTAEQPNPACASSGCSSGIVIGLMVLVTFAGYWITEWIKNTIHTTISGVAGTWYFCAGKPGGIPKNVTRGAFRRATTYSFGSVALGSLLVALINMLRQACSIAQQQEAAQGNIIGSIAFCVLGCFIGLLDWAVQFINRYALCHIALYGKPYFQAAKDTWAFMKSRGIDALINDCLVGPVISFAGISVGFLTALLSFLYLEFTKPAYNDSRSYSPVIMAFSFVIGLQMSQIIMQPISSIGKFCSPGTPVVLDTSANMFFFPSGLYLRRDVMGPSGGDHRASRFLEQACCGLPENTGEHPCLRCQSQDGVSIRWAAASGMSVGKAIVNPGRNEPKVFCLRLWRGPVFVLDFSC